MLNETEAAAVPVVIPKKVRKAEGPGSRKGSGVVVKKWKHSFYRWRAMWVEGGRNQEKGFKHKNKAEEWAGKKEIELRNFGASDSLTLDERSAVFESRADLDTAGITLREAIAIALELRRKELRSITVAELVGRVISDRERAGRSGRYLLDLRSRLGRFQKDFGPRSVATITRDELTDWIRGLGQSATSQNNYLRLIRVLFSEGVKGKFLDESPAKHVTEAKTTQTEVGTLSPAELVTLLNVAPAEMVPALAIGAFAGIRREEIKRLDWCEIDLTHLTIRIRPTKAKSARNRIVPIEENLAEWLRPYARTEGRIWAGNGDKKFTVAIRAAGFGEPGSETKEEKKAGVKLRHPFPENGLRHSYATYWLAKYQDSGALSLHLGHANSRIVFDHYRAPVPAEDAAAYWSIRPGGAENVVQMKRKGVA